MAFGYKKIYVEINNQKQKYMNTTFIAPNGVVVEGIILYSSPVYKSSKNYVDKCYDEILYAQRRIVKLHHTLKLDDEDTFQEFSEPEVEIINEYVVIPSLE